MIRLATARITTVRLAALLGVCLLLPVALHAKPKTLADYPLRIHILNRDQDTWYHRRYLEEAKGEGRANLFENSEAHGIDFSFDCSQKLKGSIGYETYPARWKKPGKELTFLLPVFGKTNTFTTCDIKTDVKDFAYMSRNGKVAPEPVADYKAWMVRHDYDPEHGKDMPIKLQPAQAPVQVQTPVQAPAPMP